MPDDPKPELLIVGRRPGRPRVAERSSVVSVYVPQTLHDHLIHLANQHDCSVSAITRQLLAGKLP